MVGICGDYILLHLIRPEGIVLYVITYKNCNGHVGNIVLFHHEVFSYDDMIYMTTISPSRLMSSHLAGDNILGRGLFADDINVGHKTYNVNNTYSL